MRSQNFLSLPRIALTIVFIAQKMKCVDSSMRALCGLARDLPHQVIIKTRVVPGDAREVGVCQRRRRGASYGSVVSFQVSVAI